MDNAKNQIVDIIKNNANILVTVSTNPSVDELSAALGLTILLDSLDKRATAVFSGAIPPAISFLEPDKTFENTADSLRDFIIALDKEKADHLRYKVEGDVVKIFITPYKTTLSQSDLDFSMGDYNVEVVLALGVKDQDHLDKALEAHGKILHDATVLTITAGADTSSLGSLDWHDGAASSLSEMIVSLADGLKSDKPILDEQISTALLTGIVSATDRFSNDHTSSRAMTVAAQLMAAGANQQLIAAKLEEAHEIAPGPVVDTRVDKEETSKPKESTTELTINRSERNQKQEPEPESSPEPASELDFELTGDVKQESAGEPESSVEDASPEPTSGESGQAAFEQQLAGLMPPSNGTTLADIENQLKEATPEPAEVPTENVAPVDQSGSPKEPESVLPELPGLPTVEATESAQVPVEPTTSEPMLPPVDQTPPQIINEHGGAFSETPATTAAPINSIQNDPHEGETTVDPFALGTAPGMPSLPPLSPDTTEGTPEGAALLAAEPAPAVTPVEAAQLAIEVPQLPPLPPLPPELATQVPLPPPPPLPSFDPAPVIAQPGAVSGDVFGDAATAPVVQPAPVPAEPGQFKIPGQG